MTKKGYRLCYDEVFLVDGECCYKGEEIGLLTIFFEYILTDETGEEKLFTQPVEQYIEGRRHGETGSNFYTLDKFFRCEYDDEHGYTMKPSVVESGEYLINVKVNSCYKYVNGCFSMPMLISHDEFCDILRNNAKHFATSNNKPTQSCAYGVVEKERRKIEWEVKR